MSARILVAGIGNIFQGDDAFGVEVARRLAGRCLPDGVVVRDFGIRGFDVAYALGEGWDLVIMVDALARNEDPGTVYVMEPDVNNLDGSFAQAEIQPHGMDPVQALRLAKSLGELPGRILVVGCEPENLGGAEGAMGLSAVVEAAVDSAVHKVELLVAEGVAVREVSAGGQP